MDKKDKRYKGQVTSKAISNQRRINNGRWCGANEGFFVSITWCIRGLRSTRKLYAPSC